MKLTCSALILLLTASASHGAQAARSFVNSGDFLVFTSNATTFAGGGGAAVPDSAVKGDYGLAVVSSTGALRSMVKFPFDYRQQASLAISPDLKYAFVSAAVLGKGLQMGIVVIQLEGNSPKVIRTVALPASKLCRSDNYVAPIAASPSRYGRYDLYVARVCFAAGPLDSYSRKATSTDVLKLSYNLSTGKLKAYSKKPYSRQIASSKSNDGYSYFVRLQVIEGIPYGLLLIRPKTFKLVRLGSQKALSFSRLRDYEFCGVDQFTFASPSQFYGTCNVYRNIPTYALVSVLGEKSTRGPIPPTNETYVYDDQGLLGRRFNWEGLPAISQNSNNVYAVLGDQLNYGNKTLYKSNQAQFGSSPKIVFKFPQSVVSKPPKSQGFLSIKELYVVP